MSKLLNRLSKELYELRLFICDEEHRIKTLECEMSKLKITERWLCDRLTFRKGELTDEEDKLVKETRIIRNKIIRDNPSDLEFEKRKIEALKKYLKEQEENLTDLISLSLI